MEHRNISKFELCTFLADESPSAMAMILHPSEGEPFMITTSVKAAADICQRLTEALQQIAKEGMQVSARILPERIVGYSAQRLQTDQEPLVEILLEGDRSPESLFGVMTQTHARRLGALLMAAAENTGPNLATRQ